MPSKILIVGDDENIVRHPKNEDPSSKESSWQDKLKQRPYLVVIPAILIVLSVAGLSVSKTERELPTDTGTTQPTGTMQAATIPSPTGTTEEEKSVNPFSWLFREEEDKQKGPGSPQPQFTQIVPGSVPNTFSVTTEQTFAGGNTSSGTSIQTSTNGSSDSLSSTGNTSTQTQDTTTDNVLPIVFQSGGQTYVYEPPATPPVELVWSRYENQQDNYSLDYPSNWQIVRTEFNNHEALFVYAPGADPEDPAVQYISFGWAAYYYPPDANYTVPVSINRVSGTIYTNGALGSSYIAAAFTYNNGYFALVNNVSDETFVYIFDHMLGSLEFGD
ncbi:MAG: hypothetical protein AAB553_08120 [Patescibacteria group bacterium]